MAYEYEGQCGSCINLRDEYDDDLEFSGGKWDYGHCPKLRELRRPYRDDICSHYINKYGCHIVTALTELLGLPEKDGILDVFRSFRANILEKDPEYKEMLKIYDVVGPKIAKEMKKDYSDGKDKEMIMETYDLIMVPIARLIKEDSSIDKNTKEKNKLEAIRRYTEITKELMKYYGIELEEKENTPVKKIGSIGGNLYE